MPSHKPRFTHLNTDWKDLYFKMKALEYPCYLFEINKEFLQRKLGSRVIEARGESIDSKFNVQQAEFARDALSKTIYSRLFDFLVETINNSMKNETAKFNIGILDIYGFEVFATNGFEQFCINYVNEKLQQIFIELTLKAEQEEYKQEGIKWNEIQYFNNKIVCDLIECKQPPGIISILDDTVATITSQDNTDVYLLNKLQKSFSTHLHFSSNNNGFIIRHYAGDVDYTIDGFCEKNRDTLFIDLIELMKSSGNSFVCNLFQEQQSQTKRPTTTGTKIKTQAKRLVDTLMKCQPHYIRCIKPNNNKLSKEINESLVKHQIKYLGLVENIKVRRAGFAYRREFNKFIQRYLIVAAALVPPKTHANNNTIKSAIQLIISEVNIDNDEWQMGKTKIFIKSPESLFQLEEVRDRKYNEYAYKIQKAFRQFKAYKYHLKVKLEAAQIVLNKKERRETSINRKYYSDYIGLDRHLGIKNLIPKRETIEFAQTCFKYDRSFKKTCRDLILTNKCIYIIGRKELKENKKKNVLVECIKRCIEFDKLDKILLSKYSDNFVVLFPLNNEYASVLEMEFKIEFLATLHKHFKEFHKEKQLNVQFVDKIEFSIKKEGWGGGGTRLLKFTQDQSLKETKIALSGKTCIVSTKQALSSTTLPNENYFKLYNFKSEPWWPKFDKLRTKYGINLETNEDCKSETIIQKPKIIARSTKSKPKVELNYQKCRAMYDYLASESDELSFKEGDIIYIIKEDPFGWWNGICNGKTGLFPFNYVQKL